MQMNALFEKQIFVLKRRRDDLFANVGDVGIDVSFPCTERQTTKVGCRFHDRLIVVQDESIQVDWYQKDVAHGGTNCLRANLLLVRQICRVSRSREIKVNRCRESCSVFGRAQRRTGKVKAAAQYTR